MLVKEYVDRILCVPVTRVGYRYIIQAIELVRDTQDFDFYKRLSTILNRPTRYLEKAMRDAKNRGLDNMDLKLKQELFNTTNLGTKEYILKATEAYRRTYENKT